MGKLQEKTKSLKVFWDDVVTETKKCSWPERQELFESTVVVIVAVVLLSVFVGVSDKVLVSVLKLIINAG